MKAKGVLREDGQKDYLIDHDGQQWRAVRTGSQFECSGFVGTLKAVKEAIASGAIEDSAPETKKAAEPEQRDTRLLLWDCIHPCAVLVFLWDEVEKLNKQKIADITHTLDCFGYLDEDGKPCRATAKREMARIRKLQEAGGK